MSPQRLGRVLQALLEQRTRWVRQAHFVAHHESLGHDVTIAKLQLKRMSRALDLAEAQYHALSQFAAPAGPPTRDGRS